MLNSAFSIFLELTWISIGSYPNDMLTLFYLALDSVLLIHFKQLVNIWLSNSHEDCKNLKLILFNSIVHSAQISRWIKVKSSDFSLWENQDAKSDNTKAR